MHQEYMTRLGAGTFPSAARRLTAEQVAHRSTWTAVPDNQTAIAAMHIIHVRPQGASTETVLNDVDPTTLDDAEPIRAQRYLARPEVDAPVHRAGRRP